MQSMRYLNLLDRFSKVKTSKCFVYNNTLFFAVDERQVSRAIGYSAENIKKLQEKIGKKVRIIREPNSAGDLKRFVGDVVSPVRFKSLEIRDSEVLLTSGSNQNKASLIGRNRRRCDELRKIVHDFFSLDLKII